MKIYWGRVFLISFMLLLIAAFLWLHDNSDEVRGIWQSFSYELSDLSASDTMRIFLYLVLGLGIIVFLLWLLSRVIGWFRR